MIEAEHFIVLQPNGVRLDAIFETLDDIPESMPDRLFEYYFVVESKNVRRVKNGVEEAISQEEWNR